MQSAGLWSDGAPARRNPPSKHYRPAMFPLPNLNAGMCTQVVVEAMCEANCDSYTNRVEKRAMPARELAKDEVDVALDGCDRSGTKDR